MDGKATAERELKPLIERAGYEVVEIGLSEKYGVDELTFYIYKKGGVSFADCEKVTAILDEPLERIDFNGGKPFILNVSSPGLDRPIVTADDFRRNEGEEVELVFREPRAKKEKTVGKLVALNDTEVTLLTQGKTKKFEREKLLKIQPNIKF